MRRHARYDLAASRVHAEGLRDAGLLPDSDHAALADALSRVEAEIEAGTFPGPGGGAGEAEDIHSAIEARLVELCGDAARRLHAGRSRNDQVVTDTLLWAAWSAFQLDTDEDGRTQWHIPAPLRRIGRTVSS